MFCVLIGPVLRDRDWRPLAQAHFSAMVSERCRLLVLSWFLLSSLLWCSRGRITFRKNDRSPEICIGATSGRSWPTAPLRAADHLTGWSRPPRDIRAAPKEPFPVAEADVASVTGEVERPPR